MKWKKLLDKKETEIKDLENSLHITKYERTGSKNTESVAGLPLDKEIMRLYVQKLTVWIEGLGDEQDEGRLSDLDSTGSANRGIWLWTCHPWRKRKNDTKETHRPEGLPKGQGFFLLVSKDKASVFGWQYATTQFLRGKDKAHCSGVTCPTELKVQDLHIELWGVRLPSWWAWRA